MEYKILNKNHSELTDYEQDFLFNKVYSNLSRTKSYDEFIDILGSCEYYDKCIEIMGGDPINPDDEVFDKFLENFLGAIPNSGNYSQLSVWVQQVVADGF